MAKRQSDAKTEYMYNVIQDMKQNGRGFSSGMAPNPGATRKLRDGTTKSTSKNNKYESDNEIFSASDEAEHPAEHPTKYPTESPPPEYEARSRRRAKSPQRTQRIWLFEILSDVSKFSRGTYPLWKWLLLFYLLWLAGTHLTMMAVTKVNEALDPVCTMRWIGPLVPFCGSSSPKLMKRANVTVVTSSQKQLGNLVTSAGKGRGLALNMLSNEYAVRDLHIRVDHSGLKRKKELGENLGRLNKLTMKASDDLTDFASRTVSMTDAVIAFDRFAIGELKTIQRRQLNPPSLSQKLASSLMPLSAFESRYETEMELKDVFMKTTTSMISDLPVLIKEAGSIRYTLGRIKHTLGQLSHLTRDELKDTPEMHVLAEMWTKLARPDDLATYKSHRQLLDDITTFYDRAMKVMEATEGSLKKMQSDLSQFRDIHAKPGLVWRDIPLEVTIERMGAAMKRLEMGRQEIDGHD